MYNPLLVCCRHIPCFTNISWRRSICLSITSTYPINHHIPLLSTTYLPNIFHVIFLISYQYLANISFISYSYLNHISMEFSQNVTHNLAKSQSHLTICHQCFAHISPVSCPYLTQILPIKYPCITHISPISCPYLMHISTISYLYHI